MDESFRSDRFAASILALLVAALASGVARGDEWPVEIRAAWIHPSWDWHGDTVAERRAQMVTYLDRLERANINLLLPWVESKHALQLLGDPQYARENSVYDTREWDVMRELIEAADQRGVEVHFWYSFTRYKRDRDAPEYNRDLTVMPAGNPSWASIRKSEYLDGHRDPADPALDAKALCPNDPEARQWTLTLLRQILDKYPGFKGVQVEEPGFLSLQRCVCPRCQNRYAELYKEPGRNLLDHIHENLEDYRTDERAATVKAAGADLFVQELSRLMEREYPTKVLSFNGGADVWSDRMRGRNWGQWAQAGLVPFYSPQCYQPNTDGFRSYVKSAMQALSGTETTVVPGIGVQYGSSPHTNPPEMVLKQIEAARDLGGEFGVTYGGVAFFKGGAFTRELVQALRSGPFQSPARLPWHVAP